MSLYEPIADTPAPHRGLFAGAPGPHRVLRVRARLDRDRARGRRRDRPRRGRHLPGRGARGADRGRADPATWPARPRSTGSPSDSSSSTCSRASRPSRRRIAATGAGASSRPRWTSRCARPARRCTSCSAATAEPVTFVVSSRMGDPPTLAPVTRRLAALSEHPLQARRDAGLDRRADRGPAGDAARSTRSTSRAPTRARSSTRRTDPDFYRKIAEAFPDAWLEDPDLETEEARNALAPYQDRITWDAPIHDVGRHPRRAGDAAHGQPQAVAVRLRAGAVRRLRVLRAARDGRLRRRPVRARRRPRARPVAGRAVPSERARTTSPRAATTRSIPSPDCPRARWTSTRRHSASGAP